MMGKCQAATPVAGSSPAGQVPPMVPSVWGHPFMNDDPYKKDREKREAAGQVPPMVPSVCRCGEEITITACDGRYALAPKSCGCAFGRCFKDEPERCPEANRHCDGYHDGYTAALDRLRNPEVVDAAVRAHCAHTYAVCGWPKCYDEGYDCAKSGDEMRAALRAAVDIMVGRKG